MTQDFWLGYKNIWYILEEEHGVGGQGDIKEF